MNWLVIAESFILSAFASASFRPDHPLVSVLRYLAWVLPFVGMSLAACVYVAIFAALSAVGTLKRQRDRMMAGLPPQLRIDLISTSSRKEWGGTCPPSSSSGPVPDLGGGVGSLVVVNNRQGIPEHDDDSHHSVPCFARPAYVPVASSFQVLETICSVANA